MRFATLFKLAAVAVMLGISTASSSAATIEFLGHGLTRDVTITHLNHAVSDRRDEFAGQLLLEINNLPFIGYCVDLDNDAPNTWTADLLPVTSIDNGIVIGYLFDTWAATVDTTLEAAGLQIAIWEVLDDYDDPDGLRLQNDDFRIVSTTAVRNQAQAYLDLLPSAAFLATYVPQSIIVFSSEVDSAQHMIVPEPGSLSILGLVAMLALRRRRR